MSFARLLYIDAMVIVTFAVPSLLVAMAVFTRPAKTRHASPAKETSGSAGQPGWRGSRSRTPVQPAAHAS